MKDDSSATNKKHKRYFIQTAAGLLLFGAVIYICGIENLLKLKRINTVPFLFSILSTLGITAFLTWRWRSLIIALKTGSDIEWLGLYRFFMLSRLASYVLPKDLVDLGGRTIWLNKACRVPLLQAGSSVVLDRFFDLFTAMVFLAGTLPYWLDCFSDPVYNVISIGLSFVLGGLFLLFGYPLLELLMLFGLKILRRLCELPWINKKPPEYSSLPGLEKPVLLKLYSISVLKNVLLAVQYILFMMALDLDISPMLLLMGTPVSQLVFVLSFAPGGIGVLEAGWFSILMLKGVPREHIAIYLVGQRVLTIVCTAVVTAVISAVYMGVKRR